jgi:peptide/nickel transport system permease protein
MNATRDVTQAVARRLQPSAGGILHALMRSRSGLIGMLIVALHLCLALAAPLIVPYNPAAQNAQLVLAAPSAEHPFGTDHLGRDIFTRTLLGGQTALVVTLISAVLAIAWGGLAGIALGFVGGRTDEVVMRLVDALLAIPWLLFLLLIVSVMGRDTWVLIVVLTFFYGLPAIRIVRAATLDFVARDFITAARARGETALTIVRRELLPNVLDVLLVEGAMQWSWMLLGFSSLSFLGFGVAPPTPDWGLMISDNTRTFSLYAWATFFPLIALSSLIIGINLASDALAKALGIDRAQGAPV